MKTIIRLLLLILSLGLTSALKAEDVQATVVSVSGKPYFVNPAGQNQELKAGLMLRPGARIVTDENGLAILLLADGSKLSLGPNTDLTLTEMTQNGDSFGNVFNMIKGLIRASVQKLTVGSKFEVTSNHGVAAVKGTEFEVEVHDKGMDARCREGRVWLSDYKRERTVELRERMRSRCDKDDQPQKPVEMKREELERFGRWADQSMPKNTRQDAENARFWNSLRPDQKLAAAGALREALGETWDEITTLKAEERQERWRERLRDSDERNLAGEDVQVDFALRKTMLDRQGRRVRFSEYLIRPSANQVQFLNYTKRGDRTDLVNVVNTYNKNLPRNLGEARDINQKIWYQTAAPKWWVTNSTVVFANSGNDSLAGATWFFDPVKFTGGCGCTQWELPVQKIELGMNLPDIAKPTLNGSLNLINTGGGANGILLERYDRYMLADSPTAPVTMLGSVSAIGNNSITAANALGSNLRWSGGIGFSTPGNYSNAPTVRALTLAELGIGKGDLASGERRSYADGTYLDIKSHAIDEQGHVQNLPALLDKGLFNAYLDLAFRTYQEISISSNKFVGLGDIDIVSQMMWWYTITKRADTL